MKVKNSAELMKAVSHPAEVKSDLCQSHWGAKNRSRSLGHSVYLKSKPRTFLGGLTLISITSAEKFTILSKSL